jgi:hypothetical protein
VEFQEKASYPDCMSSCNYQITSKLLWDCYQSLIQLARHNTVQLFWVPGHEGIVGNETADQLARAGTEHLFIGPEPACGISIGVAKKAVRDWKNRNTKNIGNPHLESNRQMDLYQGPLPEERRIR